MMAEPMKTLELHYPMIQFLITALIIHQIFSLARDWSKNVTSHPRIFSRQMEAIVYIRHDDTANENS